MFEEVKPDFNFFVPIESEGLEKAAKKTKESGRYDNMVIEGIASDSSIDLEEEILEPKGFELSRFLKMGWVNYNHRLRDDTKFIIGEPLEAKIVDNKFYIKAKLFKERELARNLYDTMIMLKEAGSSRRLGWSIEGKATERDLRNPKRVIKALITGIAITAQPINANSYADIVKGGYSNPLPEYIYEDDNVEKSIQEANGGDIVYLIDIVDTDRGIRYTIDKDLNLKVEKAVSIKTAKPLIKESLEGNKRKKRAILNLANAAMTGVITKSFFSRVKNMMVVNEAIKGGLVGKNILLKAKYIKRTGSPGNYKYEYAAPKRKGGIRKEKINEIKKDDQFVETFSKLSDTQLEVNLTSLNKEKRQVAELILKKRGVDFIVKDDIDVMKGFLKDNNVDILTLSKFVGGVTDYKTIKNMYDFGGGRDNIGKISALYISQRARGLIIKLESENVGHLDRVYILSEKTVESSSFTLNKVAQSKGLGTKIFNNQVTAYRKQGYKTIEISAAKLGGYNGYYTWARLGYNMFVEDEILGFLNLVEKSKNKQIRDVDNLSELMSFPEGRNFWKEEGFAFDGEFDLAKDSKSSFLLEKYMEEKKSKVVSKAIEDGLIGEDISVLIKAKKGLQVKYPNSRWVTINGAKVLIGGDGNIIVGAGGKLGRGVSQQGRQMVKIVNQHIDRMRAFKDRSESKGKDLLFNEINFSNAKIQVIGTVDSLNGQNYFSKKQILEINKLKKVTSEISFIKEKENLIKILGIIKESITKMKVNESKKREEIPKKVTQRISEMKDLNNESKKLDKVVPYDFKTYSVKHDVLKNMSNIAKKVDIKKLSFKTREEVESLLSEANIEVKLFGDNKELNEDFKDKFDDEGLAGKIDIISRRLKYEDKIKEKEGLSNRALVQKYGELSFYEDYIEEAKDLIVKMSKEYVKKETTEVLQYKLF